jgi:iron complex outermembrane recepter protein
MKKSIIFTQIIIFYLSLISFSYAQIINGKVTDATTGSAIESASITVKGTKQGTTTNSEGNFTLTTKSGTTLVVSATGYVPQEIKATENVSVALQPQATDLTDVVVVGTRGLARAKTETAVPIDVIKINQVGTPTAKMDLTSVLNMAAPSFNYNKQSGSDGADHIDLGTLRGLGPDQTLVLINGKRRHNTALVALFGTRGRGASGTDLNAFPQSAVDRIEILRDGASAQYGSDAIAGVMNIILKKDINHWTVNAGWAGHYDTKFNASKFNAGNQYVSAGKVDGQTFTLSATNGFAVGNSGGFVSFGLNLLTQEKTFRQADTTDWQTDKTTLPLINAGRRAFGDGSVKTYGASYNMELPIKNTNATFYSFGIANIKESDAYAYSRNYSWNPERFPTDAGGNLIFVPEIMQKTNDGETYFNPRIGTNINDASIAFGIKGKTKCDWNWDASLTTGKNDFQFNGKQTFNASLIGNTTKTSFEDGGYRFRQTTINVDFSKAFKKIAQGLNIGYGVEIRNEKYSINKGEEASYKSYDLSKAPGAQGFPGFSPKDTITAKRANYSAYVDAELNVTKAWLIDIAARAENYSDFGSVLTYKFATRLKVTDNFNLRGSASTGFRAPSLQQVNFTNTSTSFLSGSLVQSRIARNGDDLSNSVGIAKLKEETSINTSVGFAWKPIKGLTFTIDGYMVKIKDRVVISGLFASDPSLPSNFNAQLITLDVSTAQFITNAVNTTNFGLDVVVDYSKKLDNATLRILLAGNIQKAKVDKINVPVALTSTASNIETFYSKRDVAFIESSAPASKFNLSIDYATKKLGYNLSFSTFGKMKMLGFGDVPSDLDPAVLVPGEYNYSTKITTNLSVSYKVSKVISVFAGADNVFNIHPDFSLNPLAKNAIGYNETGGAWDSVQMGYNGRKLFTKLVLNF